MTHMFNLYGRGSMHRSAWWERVFKKIFRLVYGETTECGPENSKEALDTVLIGDGRQKYMAAKGE